MGERRIVGVLGDRKLAIYFADLKNKTLRRISIQKPRRFSSRSWSDQCIFHMDKAAKKYKCQPDYASLFDEEYICRMFGRFWRTMVLEDAAHDIITRFVWQFFLFGFIMVLFVRVYGLAISAAVVIYLFLCVPSAVFFLRQVRELRKEAGVR